MAFKQDTNASLHHDMSSEVAIEKSDSLVKLHSCMPSLTMSGTMACQAMNVCADGAVMSTLACRYKYSMTRSTNQNILTYMHEGGAPFSSL